MKLLKNRKRTILPIFIVLIIALVAALYFINENSNIAPKGMRQVKSFNANGICLAINNPECGYCPGKVIDEQCFVDKDKSVLEQYP